MTFWRSGVTDMLEMTMSALPVCRNGTRLAPVVGTISSVTPRPLASRRAVSTSEPVGLSAASFMP